MLQESVHESWERESKYRQVNIPEFAFAQNGRIIRAPNAEPDTQNPKHHTYHSALLDSDEIKNLGSESYMS